MSEGEGQGIGSHPDSAHAALLGAALAAVSDNPRVDALIERQIVLADLAIESARRDDAVHAWSLRFANFSAVMKVAFEVSLAFILMALAAGIGGALWTAAHDNSLVIETFSVPPDMAARGLTGQAIAAQLQDKLAAMQDATDSARPPDSYGNNWGNDIKVQIPNTGVSISEFYRYLASWLGHQTHITGEVYRAADGTIVITARAGSNGGGMVKGTEAGFDGLMQQAAEAIYAQTQPYRYAVFMGNTDPWKAIALFKQLQASGSPIDRIWAHIGMGSIYDAIDPPLGPVEMRKAAALAPDFVLAYQNLTGEENGLGHFQRSLEAARMADQLFARGVSQMSERATRISVPASRANLAFDLGDFRTALRYSEEAAELPDYSGIVEASRLSTGLEHASLHEAAAARQIFRALPPVTKDRILAPRYGTKLQVDYMLGDWNAAIADAKAEEDVLAQAILHPPPTVKMREFTVTRTIFPYLAVALAMTGQRPQSHVLIDDAPRDCYPCWIARGQIAAIERNWRASDDFFATAVHAEPESYLGYHEWGTSLMVRGDLDAALAKFAIAHAKAPHFADSLERWGEALIRKDRSDLALPKFQEAARDAPNWGRLYLKWGEALLWSGKQSEARRALATAARLELSWTERMELERARALAAEHGA